MSDTHKILPSTPRPFADLLGELERGQLHAEVSETFRELIAALGKGREQGEYGRSGSISAITREAAA